MLPKALVLSRLIWCCRCGLNTRPPPYQGGALPLSYGSESAQGRQMLRRKRGGNCHTVPGDARRWPRSCNAGGQADNATAMENEKSGKDKKSDSRSQRLAAEL